MHERIHAHLQIRQAELYLPIQPAGPHQGWIQSIGPVCSHQHFDVASWVKTIQLVDELQHSPLHFIVTPSPIIKTSTWREETHVFHKIREGPSGHGRGVTAATQ